MLAHEVAADNDVVLDDGLASEDDVGGAVKEGAAGDFVASVLQGGGVIVSMVVGRECLVEGDKRGERTVSMYSPRAALFGGILKSTTMSHASCCKQEFSSQVSVQLFIPAQSRATDAYLEEESVPGYLISFDCSFLDHTSIC